MAEAENKSFITDLWERRVPQFIATYVGVCWGILQFLKFASERYGLPDFWIDKFLIFALILIPAVAVFTYNHGRPGKDKWKSYEKIFVPINFIIAFLFAGIFSPGNQMNASINEVQITTETGDTISRVIPSLATSKSFAAFPFVNKSKDEDLDWLRIGYPTLITADVTQDMRTFFINFENLKYDYEGKQKTLNDDLAFSYLNKFAKDYNADYMITGSFDKKDNVHHLSVKVYETQLGEVFFEKDFQGENFYTLTDEFTKDLTGNLFLKENQSKKFNHIDLPVSDLITSNPKALKLFFQSATKYWINYDVKGSIVDIDKALKLDPDSPELLKMAATFYQSEGKLQEGAELITRAIQHSDALPERQKFMIKQLYYGYNQQMDKYFKVLENWKTLYPNDYAPYASLISFKMRLGELDAAKSLALEAKDNGHRNNVLMNLATICIRQNNLDEAESYLNQYYDLYPDKKKDDTQLANIYTRRGKLDKALKHYENIELLNPTDYKNSKRIGNIYSKQGKYAEALNRYKQGLKDAKVTTDSIDIFHDMMNLFHKYGNASEFNSVAAKRLKLMQSYYPESYTISLTMIDAGDFIELGQKDVIEKHFAELLKSNEQMSSYTDCIVDFVSAITEENKEALETVYTGFCKQILTNSSSFDYLIRGWIAKLGNNNEDAIRLLETYIDSSGNASQETAYTLAELYTINGDNKKAINICEENLVSNPSNPLLLIELANALNANGQEKEANKTYELVAKIWENVTPKHYYYERFKNVGKQIGFNG